MATLLALLFCWTAVAQGVGVGEAAPKLALTPENFIGFIKSPPAVDTLIFRRVLFNKPLYFKSKKEVDQYVKSIKGKPMADANKGEELFALRYQSPKDYIFQQIDSVTNAWSKGTRLMTFAGRNNGVSWSITPDGAISTDSTNGIYSSRGKENPAFALQYQFATEILRLGMYDVRPETIAEDAVSSQEISGFAFKAISNRGLPIQGTAFASDGYIVKINYTILGATEAIVGRIIDLTYEDGVLSNVQVSNKIVNKPEPVLHSLYEIHSISMTPEHQKNDSCSVNQFLGDADRSILVKENGDVYDLKRPSTVPLVQHPVPGGIHLEPGQKRLIMVGVFALIIFIPPIMIFSKIRQRKGAPIAKYN